MSPAAAVAAGLAAVSAAAFGLYRLKVSRIKSGQRLRVKELEKDLARAREGMRDDREFIRSILASMFEGVLVIGPDNRVLFANAVFARMFGSGGEPPQERNYWEVFRQEKLHTLIEEALATRQGVQGELSVFFPEERHLQVQISPIRTNENFLGIVLVLHDVSSLKRLERMRSEFVANVSHELKTPLASIIGAVETLKGGAVDDLENRGTFLGMIEHHSAELKQLIDDLLDLSRIESGNLAMQKDSFRVKDLFEDLKKTFSRKAAEKGIDLRFEARGDPEIRADRPRIRQALANLIENALNYTDKGGKVAVEGSRNGDGTAFAVTDTGIGIAPEDQPRIFERFYRVEKSRSRHAGGTGLGLAIVKHVAESHGGRVEVKSELQKGSSFRLVLPA